VSKCGPRSVQCCFDVDGVQEIPGIGIAIADGCPVMVRSPLLALHNVQRIVMHSLLRSRLSF
jgi:hypothetical protein